MSPSRSTPAPDVAPARNVAAEDLRAAIRQLPTGRYSMLADLDVALEEARRTAIVEVVAALKVANAGLELNGIEEWEPSR